jgi:DnaK suppressor protein
VSKKQSGTSSEKSTVHIPSSKPKNTKAAAARLAADTPPSAVSMSTVDARFSSHSSSRSMSNSVLDASQTPSQIDPKLANAWKNKTGRELSDAEVLAMPESEYMGEKQLVFFRHKLSTERAKLLSNASETTEHLREDTSIVPDPADRATIEEEHALELRTRDRERKLLKKIEQSIRRIDEGDYGYCDETGEPIGLGRLIARPTATLSLEAQQRRELRQKMQGD